MLPLWLARQQERPAPPGSVLTANASLIAGAGTGAALAAGDVLRINAGFTVRSTLRLDATSVFKVGAISWIALDGEAIFSALPAAPGATLTANVSLVSGAATGAAAASGDVLTVRVGFLPRYALRFDASPIFPAAAPYAGLDGMPAFAAGDALSLDGYQPGFGLLKSLRRQHRARSSQRMRH
jgi:hypothetical protein